MEGAKRIEDIVNSLEEHVHPAEGAEALPCDLKSGLESSLRLLEHKMSGVVVHAQYGSTRPVLALGREPQSRIFEPARQRGARRLVEHLDSARGK